MTGASAGSAERSVSVRRGRRSRPRGSAGWPPDAGTRPRALAPAAPDDHVVEPRALELGAVVVVGDRMALLARGLDERGAHRVRGGGRARRGSGRGGAAPA